MYIEMILGGSTFEKEDINNLWNKTRGHKDGTFGKRIRKT